MSSNCNKQTQSFPGYIVTPQSSCSQQIVCGTNTCAPSGTSSSQQNINCQCMDCRNRSQCDCCDCRNQGPQYDDTTCQKCGDDRKTCPCINYVSRLRVKCGNISATLTKTSSVTSYIDNGEIITYTYEITNTGTAPICYPIKICDDVLGSMLINMAKIRPGESAQFSRNYTVTILDVQSPGITNSAIAYIQVSDKNWVYTNCSTVTVTMVTADVAGAIAQTIELVDGSVLGEFTVTLSNLSPTTAAQGVTLPLNYSAVGSELSIPVLTSPLPPGVTITSENTTPSSGTILITADTLPPNTSYDLEFAYTLEPLLGAETIMVTLQGNITTATFDPDQSNNYVNISTQYTAP